MDHHLELDLARSLNRLSDTWNATYESRHSFDQFQILGEQDSFLRLLPTTTSGSIACEQNGFDNTFEEALEDTLNAQNHCPRTDPRSEPKAQEYHDFLSFYTGPEKEGIEILNHASGYSESPPHTPTSGDSCRNTRTLRSSFEQGPRSVNRTSTNLFPQSDFDLNHNDINSMNTFFDLDPSSTANFPPTYGTPDDDQLVSQSSDAPTLSRSPLSSTSHSETVERPPTVSSASFQHANLTPSKTPLRDSEPARYLPVSGGPAFKCAKCPRVFASRSLLERHWKTCERFRCTKGCNKSFTLEKDRRRHESTIHEDQNVQCEICGRKGRKDNLRRHMRTHGS